MMQMFTSCVKVATTCRSKLFKGTHLFSPIDSWNLLAISGLGTVRLYTVLKPREIPGSLGSKFDVQVTDFLLATPNFKP